MRIILLKPIKDFKLYYITKDHKHQTIISKESISTLTKKNKFCKYESVTELALFMQLLISEIMNIIIETEKNNFFNEQWLHVIWCTSRETQFAYI